jgi:7-cyano-7-deazaguanine synthase
MANLATKAGVEGDSPINICTPLIDLTKSDIIKTGLNLNVDYGLTHSCYDPDQNGYSCGHCDACNLRIRGFEKIGLSDPLKYSD